MSKRATTQELARLIWRHESARYPEARLAKQLEHEIDRSQRLNVEWRPILRGLRYRPALLMEQCDEAINQSLNACTRKDYRESLNQLREVQTVLACLRELMDGFAEYDSAMETYNELLSLMSSEYLCGLPSIQTIAQLFAEADELLAGGTRTLDGLHVRGASRQARFIARLCREKILVLQKVADDGGLEIPRLLNRIKHQSAFCAQTESFAPAPADFKIRRAFELLPDLLAQGRVTLVARLTDEIECELASRRAVLATYKKYLKLHRLRENASQEVLKELQQIVRRESWGRAATYLLHQTLTVLSGRAVALQSSVQQAKRKLDAINEAGTRLSQENVPNIS